MISAASTGVAGEAITTIDPKLLSAFAVLPAGTVPRSAEAHVIDLLVGSEAPANSTCRMVLSNITYESSIHK